MSKVLVDFSIKNIDWTMKNFYLSEGQSCLSHP
ncbi:hypothetical protein 7t3_0206 [Salmonella phage 7t3]|nr:hypothetical protein 7t3_0206 [Salmonella phage 7t3]